MKMCRLYGNKAEINSTNIVVSTVNVNDDEPKSPGCNCGHGSTNGETKLGVGAKPKDRFVKKEDRTNDSAFGRVHLRVPDYRNDVATRRKRRTARSHTHRADIYAHGNIWVASLQHVAQVTIVIL